MLSTHGYLWPIAAVLLAVQVSVRSQPAERPQPASDLDDGFHLLYELKPAAARARFAAWQASHPEDLLADAAEAASYLFEECYRQGVLTSEFFLDDDRFFGKVALTPDQKLRTAFYAAVERAQRRAQKQLETDPNDANALFAMTLSTGMQADYASLIEKQQVESLGKIRDADVFAKRLLAVNPDAADAYQTLGVANYIIGSLPAMTKFMLHVKGISGNKSRGMEQLKIAATRGRYLRPFAKIILAMAALREKQIALARIQLQELVEAFPQNPLFTRELAKLSAN